MVTKKVTGRPRRFEGDAVRIPLELSPAENDAFMQAKRRVFPLANRTAVLRHLIAKWVKEAGVKWPLEEP